MHAKDRIQSRATVKNCSKLHISVMAVFGELSMSGLDLHRPAATAAVIALPVYLELSSSAAAAAASAAEAARRHRRALMDATDEFLMYTYKVRRCPKNRSHDWTDCPFAHRGEKARRRDPRKFPYNGIACPEFRQSGECRRGQSCEYAHGVFEFWLHPSRYRTRACEAGLACPRRICFFAHTAEELRPEVFKDWPAGAGAGAEPAAKAPPNSSTSSSVSPNGGRLQALHRERARGAGKEEEVCDLPDIGWVLDLLN